MAPSACDSESDNGQLVCLDLSNDPLLFRHCEFTVLSGWMGYEQLTTTVDHSGIRGLVTASPGFVVELPRSEIEGHHIAAVPHSCNEGAPNRLLVTITQH